MSRPFRLSSVPLRRRSTGSGEILDAWNKQWNSLRTRGTEELVVEGGENDSFTLQELPQLRCRGEMNRVEAAEQVLHGEVSRLTLFQWQKNQLRPVTLQRLSDKVEGLRIEIALLLTASESAERLRKGY